MLNLILRCSVVVFNWIFKSKVNFYVANKRSQSEFSQAGYHATKASVNCLSTEIRPSVLVPETSKIHALALKMIKDDCWCVEGWGNF